MSQAENFKDWNEKMAVKYNPDHYHNSHNIFIRLLSHLRTRLIIRLLDVRPKDEVIDLGCGSGNMLAAIHRGRLTGIDLSASLIQLAENKLKGRGATIIEGSVEDLPAAIRSKKYDKIFSSEVIEHLEHPEKMIDEIVAIAKPESLIVISFPNEHLIGRIKFVLLKLGLFKILFKGLPPQMADEWHLHEIKLEYFKQLISGRLRIITIKKIPSCLLPLHYVFLCQINK